MRRQFKCQLSRGDRRVFQPLRHANWRRGLRCRAETLVSPSAPVAMSFGRIAHFSGAAHRRRIRVLVGRHRPCPTRLASAMSLRASFWAGPSSVGRAPCDAKSSTGTPASAADAQPPLPPPPTTPLNSLSHAGRVNAAPYSATTSGQLDRALPVPAHAGFGVRVRPELSIPIAPCSILSRRRSFAVCTSCCVGRRAFQPHGRQAQSCHATDQLLDVGAQR